MDVGGTGVLSVHVAGFSMVVCRCRACVRRVRARRLPAVVEVDEALRAGVRRMRSRRLLEGVKGDRCGVAQRVVGGAPRSCPGKV